MKMKTNKQLDRLSKKEGEKFAREEYKKEDWDTINRRAYEKTLKFPICKECGYRHYKRASAKCVYYIKDQSDNRKEVDWK